MRKGKFLAGVLSAAMVLGSLTLPENISIGGFDFGAFSVQAADEVASGTCGDDLTWVLDDDGVLTISGSGEMDDYEFGGEAPWYSYIGDITTIVMEDGVTSIGDYAFAWNYYITAIELPDNLTTIGNGAFLYCWSLESINIPDTVTTIGDEAFFGCSALTSIELPDSLTSIGSQVFGGCEIEIICSDDCPIIGGSVTLYGLDSIYEDYLTIPSDYTDTYQIEDEDMVSCTLECGESVEVSSDGYIELARETWYQGSSFASTAYIEGATVIYALLPGTSYIEVSTSSGIYYFKVEVVDYGEVYLDEVIDEFISENITDDMEDLELMETICSFPASYDYDAFYGSAKGMVIAGGGDCIASTDLILQVCEKLNINAWSRNGNKDSGAGSGHVNAIAELNDLYYVLEAGYYEDSPRSYSVTVRTTLFSTRSVDGGLEVYQYDGNEEGAYELEIPEEIDGETVVSIGSWFARNDTNLTKVTIPDTVTSIGICAFDGCSSLESFNISASVETIGNRAFGGCTSLTSFTCDSDNLYFTIEDGVLYNKSKTIVYAAPAVSEVVLADTVESFAVGAFSENDYLTEIVIPSSVTDLGSSTFYNCSNLTKVVLPDTITTIGTSVFLSCSSLTDINLPDGLESIGDSAFCYCSSLVDIDFPDSLKSIGYMSFYLCEGLIDVDLPDGLESIGDDAFGLCFNLETIDFPSSLESIGDYAFYECMSLKEVSIPEGVTSVGEMAFGYCYDLTEISLPSTLTTIAQGTFWECTSLTSVEIPEGVETIELGAFYGCSSLTSVTLSSTVQTIEQGAFESCESLMSIIIPDTVTEIGQGAFGCMREYNSSTGSYEDVTIDGFVVYGHPDTAAEEYAEEYGFLFINIDDTQDIADQTIEIEFTTAQYTGGAIEPVITIEGLTEGTDYTVTYKNNTEVGTATAVVSGLLYYIGTYEITFEITKADQTLTVSIGSSTLTVGDTSSIAADGIGDITYSSSDESVATVDEAGLVTAVSAGTATITVTAAGDDYYNSATETIAITVTEVGEVTENGYLLGDVNNDGEITYLDAMMVLRYDAVLIDLDETQLLAGDVNKDGEVNSLDAIKILRYDAGLITSF